MDQFNEFFLTRVSRRREIRAKKGYMLVWVTNKYPTKKLISDCISTKNASNQINKAH